MIKFECLIILILSIYFNDSYSQVNQNDTIIDFDFSENKLTMDENVIFENKELYSVKFFDSKEKIKSIEVFRISDCLFFKKSYFNNGKINEYGKISLCESSIVDSPQVIAYNDPNTGELLRKIYVLKRVSREGEWFFKDSIANEIVGNYSMGLKHGSWKYYTSWHVGGSYYPGVLAYQEIYKKGSLEKVDFENITLSNNTDSIKTFLFSGIWRFQTYDSINFHFNSYCSFDNCKQIKFLENNKFIIERVVSPYKYDNKYIDNSYLSKIRKGNWSLVDDKLILEVDSMKFVLLIKYLSKSDLVVKYLK